MAVAPEPSLDLVSIEALDKKLPPDSLYIFTDIETESLKAKTLLQIAAVTSEGQQFNNFVNPKIKLSESCTNFSGFYFYNNELYRSGLRLRSFPIQKALQNFTNWISSFNKPVVLVFHNGFTFDCEVLARFLIRFNIPIPANLITVADTLPYVRIHLKSPEITDHKLTTLARYFSIHYELAHDALSDSLTLKSVSDKLITLHNTTFREIFKESCRPFSDYTAKILAGIPIPPLKKKTKKTKNSQKAKTKDEKQTKTQK